MSINIYSANDLTNSQFFTDPSISLITSQGKPIKVAIPVDERFIDEGAIRSLALSLVENKQITPSIGANMAKMSLETFLKLMGRFGISPVAEISPKEIRNELAI